MNLTFCSLLGFFINCAQKLQKDVCREIYGNVSICELIDIVGDESVLSLYANLFLVNFLNIMAEECAEHHQNDIRIIAEKELLLMQNAKLKTKKIAIKFVHVLYNNFSLFHDLCHNLVFEKELLSLLHDLVDAQDENVSQSALAVTILIAKHMESSHQKILDEFGDLLNDDIDQMEELISIIDVNE